MKYGWYDDMVHITNQCTRTRMLQSYSYAALYAHSTSPCLNFHHDPLAIFPIKYLGIDEHGGNYN